MALKVGMLVTASVCSAVYGYAVLFELTGSPVIQLRSVMDIAGRVAAVSWVVYANAALREKAAKAEKAAHIVNSVGGGLADDDGAVIQFRRR